MPGPFDPSNFLDETEAEAGSTQYVNVPEGEYPGTITEEPIFRGGTSQKTGETYATVDLKWKLDLSANPAAVEALGRDSSIVRQSIFLDLDANEKLAKGPGKNVKYNRLKDAVGLNKPGFTARQLAGQSALCKVKHRTGDDGQVRADVVEVAKLK